MGAETTIGWWADARVFGERADRRSCPPRRRGGQRGSSFLFVVALAVALGTVVGLTAASASTGVVLVVNDTGDAVDAAPGNGTCATAAPVRCTLRAAIQESNALPGADTISLPAGTYELAIAPQNQNLAGVGDLDITDSVTIAGAQGAASSTIVDGGTPAPGSPPEVHGLDRLFEVLVDGGSVTFSDLTLREGWAAEYGGAIMNSSSAGISVVRSTLVRNGAGKTGGAIDNHFAGSLDMVDSALSDNYAPEAGSAINNNRGGGLTLTSSVVSSNSAADAGLDESLAGAGAIANNAELDAVGSMVVIDSEIRDNRAGAGRSGAGISNDGAGTVVVTDTIFDDNHAVGDGGALYNVNGIVTVTRGTFTGNAGNNGGAISSTGFGFLDVVDSTFSKNLAADWGGALHNGNTGSMSIRSSRITENAGLNGGGFGNEGSGLVTVESSTFTKNVAIDTATAVGGEGGGMHSNSGGEVVIIGGGFTENRALAGGGFSNEGGGIVTMTGSRIASNHADEAGGGILVESGAVRMVGIDVVGNVSDSPLEGGGGISYAGDKAVAIGESAAIESSRIRDNTSKGDGGGIDSRGDGPLVITTTSITGNTALIGGAIHHVGDATLLVTRSTLSGNVAENGAGAFTDGDGEATVESSTVSGNRANQFGGGLLISSRMTVRNTTVASNSAASGGGVNNGGGDLVGDGTVFLANAILSGNLAGGNCAGTMTSRGGNVENTNTCQLHELSDQPGTDPRLGPLADNGGPTQTHALLPGSPAQERAVCTELDPCPSVDQRGVARPAFVEVDAGAYESETTPGGEGGPQVCSGRTERPVPADYDSWVSQGSPGTNSGTDSILDVASQSGGNERTLLHFALPPVPPGCELVGATLRLYSSAATAGRTLEARRIASPWNELSVTWANQPAATGPPATTESGLDFREWDVLAQAQDMYENGAHGFLVRDATENGGGAQSFHSREKGTDRPPELVLVYDDPDATSFPPGTCPTTPQLLFADRDSWVSQGSPTNNFGTDSTLKVKSQIGSNSQALLRFPLPTLPGGCTSVASATLRLDLPSAKEGRTLALRRAGSSWTEAGVTWANQPPAVGSAATIAAAAGLLELDVTAQVLDTYVATNDGFVISDAEEDGVGDEQSINSRHKTSDGAPELVFVLDDTTPETSLGPIPPSPTESRDATFTFTSDRTDATFECSLNGGVFTPCTSPHALTSLAEGEHRLEVRAKRPVRAVDPTPVSVTWTIAIPPRTTLTGPGSPSTSADAPFSFAADDPQATFECSLDDAAWAGCSSPLELTGLADGAHQLRVRGTDVLGNVEPVPAAHAWTVAVPPETAIDSEPAALTNLAFATFAFSAVDNGPAEALVFACSLDGAPFAGCSSTVLYEELADGMHTFAVRATDPAGNTDQSAAGSSWKVDTAPPETSISSGPPALTNVANATFSFESSEDGSSFACSLDGAAHGACESAVSYDGLTDGEHELSVLATDLAGNEDQSAASYAWTVDTAPPETSLDTVPPTLTNDASASFALASSEDTSTFACSLDGAVLSACESPVSYTGLSDGEHTLSVRATDPAGNEDTSAATWTWTVDTAPPQTAIDSGPPAQASSTTANLSFSSSEDGSSFACSLDGAAFTTCATPVSYTALAEGAHTFAVRATDAAGNEDESAASVSWTVDTTAPQTSIATGPPALTNVTNASFTFTSSETGSSFTCSLDGAVFSGCATPAEYAGLDDRAHTLEVKATDAAGNSDTSAAVWVWTVDTTPPETSIDPEPPALTSSASATLSFAANEPSSTFACSLDGAVSAGCASPVTLTGLTDGMHTFAVIATDAAGNEDASEATTTWTVDTTAPQTEIVTGPSGLTRAASAAFTFGSSETGSSFACSLDGGLFSPCSSPKNYSGLADGTHSFAVRATDAAGNEDGSAASASWTVDTTAPDTTIDDFPPALTNVASASFSFGATEAGSTFACSLDGAAFAGCVSPVAITGLTDGVHTFEVLATDAAGNEDASAARFSWTVDTTAPDTTIASAPGSVSGSASASFSFGSGESASTFACSLDGAAFSSCTSPKEYAGLADGLHSFAVRATDAAGNSDASEASFSWTVDTAAPDTTITAFPPVLTSSTGASFSFGATESGSTFACSLDGGAYSSCTSPKGYTNLGDGPHTFAVRATDAAGNTDASAAERAWTIDTTPPDTSITSGPPALTGSTGATFSFASAETGSTFACSLDGAAFSACTSPVSYSGLGDGLHTFAVRATDAAGNTDQSPREATWTVDTVAPDTSIATGPPERTNATTASFSFSSTEAGSNFECALDTAGFSACGSTVTYTGFAEGLHTFAVRATDAAGNGDTSAASFTWTVDTTAPATSIGAGPPALTNASSASFTFTSNEAASTFSCSLDGGAYSSCASGQLYAGLGDGPHTFAVRATDVAGNTDASPASHSWTVDTTAPDTTIGTSPPPRTSSTVASFPFTATEVGSTFACSLDSAAFVSCASPQPYSGLGDGAHTFAVRATDAAGNTDQSPAAATWTVDTTPPQTTIDSAPPATTTATSATFEFSASELDVTFACSLDGGAFAVCDSPHQVTGLALGSHELSVRATDVTGNVDTSPASHAWTVQATDTTPPQTTITAGPSGPTNDTTPTFEFTASEPATFQCRVDSAIFTACSSPHTTGDLSQGAHTFEVRATDTAGLTDATPASSAFTVDTVAPQTTISSGPPSTTTNQSATFAFTSSEAGSSFACALDGSGFAPCTSPVSYTVGAGAHAFEVQATDAAANTDSTPASHAWTVQQADTTAPDTTIGSGPSGPTNDSTPTFAFSSSETGSTFECALDGAAFAACVSPVTTAALTDGAHSLEVRATDAAGNTDPSPATRSFTVDTVAPQTTISSGPPSTTTSQSAAFAFGSSETGSSFACALDGSGFAPCTSPVSYTVGVGAHSFEVRATDAASNTDASPASHAWTVQAGDTTPPETTIGSGPSGLTADSTPTFAFSSSETGSSFTCSLDDAAFATCASPVTTAALADGAHTFSVRATDSAGNTDPTPATRSFTVDTVAPDTTITTGPSGPTNDSTPTFAFSSTQTGSTFQCSVDTAAFNSCVSPVTTSTLSTGAHTFRVRAIDPAGNIDQTPASRSITVDTTAPETTINSGPPSSTTNPTATFTFSSTDTSATFECSLGTAAFASCTSPASYTVAVGSHQFRVRARDAAGNVDATPASQSWTVTADTTAPQTTISSAPPATTTNPVATFEFTSSETGSSFECSLDGAAFASCTSPASYTVAAGAHTFQVRARDAAGNVDATPASSSWTLQATDTTPPETTIESGPGATTTDSLATFTFTSSETGSSFSCSLDGAGFSPCTSPVSYTVSVGSHTFQVRAQDAAGNVDSTPAGYAWTVEALPPGSCTGGGVVTLGAAADSWVLESSPTSNYQTDSVLKVDSKAGGNARVLVRFALPAVPAGCQVVDADLRLYAGSYKTDRTIQAFAVTAAWTESGVTWGNQPAATGTAATTASGSGYLEWSVTAQLAGTYATSTGFLVRDQTEGGGGIEQGFHSREKGTDDPPQLVVTFG